MTARYRSNSIDPITLPGVRYQNIDYLASTTYYPSNSVHVANDSIVNYNKPGKTETMFDHTHPNFARNKARGVIYNNPMSKTTINEDAPAIFCKQKVKNYRCMTETGSGVNDMFHLHTTDEKGGEYTLQALAPTRTAYLACPPSSTLRSFDTLRDLAITAAWADMGSSDILLGTCIAESGKTMRGLLSCARKVLKVAKTLRKPSLLLRHVNSKSIRDHIRAYEDARMEVRYGLRPLYYDILGVMKLTQKPYGLRSTFRGHESDSNSVSDSWTGPSALTNTYITVDRKSTISLDIRAGVLTEAFDQTLWHRMGVSLIAETMWELVPFSFIADWFGNFGSLISSWTPKPGIVEKASWFTAETAMHQTVTVGLSSTYNWQTTSNFQRGLLSKIETESSGFFGTNYKFTSYKTRYPNPIRPNLPTISVNLNPQKLLDLAAIGKQVARTFQKVR